MHRHSAIWALAETNQIAEDLLDTVQAIEAKARRAWASRATRRRRKRRRDDRGPRETIQQDLDRLAGRFCGGAGRRRRAAHTDFGAAKRRSGPACPRSGTLGQQVANNTVHLALLDRHESHRRTNPCNPPVESQRRLARSHSMPRAVLVVRLRDRKGWMVPMTAMVWLMLISVIAASALFVALAAFLRAIAWKEAIGGRSARFGSGSYLAKIRLGRSRDRVADRSYSETGDQAEQSVSRRVRDGLIVVDGNLAQLVGSRSAAGGGDERPRRSRRSCSPSGRSGSRHAAGVRSARGGSAASAWRAARSIQIYARESTAVAAGGIAANTAQIVALDDTIGVARRCCRLRPASNRSWARSPPASGAPRRGEIAHAADPDADHRRAGRGCPRRISHRDRVGPARRAQERGRHRRRPRGGAGSHRAVAEKLTTINGALSTLRAACRQSTVISAPRARVKLYPALQAEGPSLDPVGKDHRCASRISRSSSTRRASRFSAAAWRIPTPRPARAARAPAPVVRRNRSRSCSSAMGTSRIDGFRPGHACRGRARLPRRRRLPGAAVVEARSVATLFRGYEVIMVGRDPRDAIYITSRACGVCGGVHSTCSAWPSRWRSDVSHRRSASSIRNLALALEFLYDHPLHLHLLAGPITQPPSSNRRTRRFAPAQRRPKLRTGTSMATRISVS